MADLGFWGKFMVFFGCSQIFQIFFGFFLISADCYVNLHNAFTKQKVMYSAYLFSTQIRRAARKEEYGGEQ
jgi:hypothetical protein